MNAIKELFIPFENDQHRLGRLSVYQTHKGFEVHIDIVLEETRKIFKHLKIVQGPVESEVIQSALIEMRQLVAVKWHWKKVIASIFCLILCVKSLFYANSILARNLYMNRCVCGSLERKEFFLLRQMSLENGQLKNTGRFCF